MSKEIIEKLPERVVVTRTFTYFPKELVGDPTNSEYTYEDFLNTIEAWAQDDMRSPVSRHDMVWQAFDADGNELEGWD